MTPHHIQPDVEAGINQDKEEELMNNPFAKHLFDRLGPEFDPTNLINRNKKMFKNFNMLDGIALCSDNDYQRTYLDKIKIDENNQPGYF